MDRDQQEVVKSLSEKVKAKFMGEGSGHDWWHILRVRNNAMALLKSEDADPYIVELAALLHDIADHKFHNGDLEIGPKTARAMMEDLDVEDTIIERVVEIVKEVSYKGAGVKTPVKTIEGAIVQDADRLDAIGAIGIARAFAYGGHRNRLLYDPERPPQMHNSFEAYYNDKGATINHFYEKLLLLKDRMNTETGKLIAQKRHDHMELFLEEFYREWEGKDWES